MGFWSALFGSGNSNGVRHVRTYDEHKMTPVGPATFTYELHRAGNRQQAIEFLEGRSVSKKLYYVVVETPDGNWCKDVQGLYRED